MTFPWRRLCAFLLSLLWIGGCSSAAEGFRLDFLWKTDRKEERLSLIRRGTYIRIDQPANLFSLIYNVELQSFLGLEHLDAHFWSFDWPTIRSHTQASRENGWRLRSDPFQEDPTIIPFSPSTPSSSPRATVLHDLTRFSWIREADRGVRWTGKSEGGEVAEALAGTQEGDHRAFWLSTVEQLKTLSQIFHFLLGREAWPEPALAIWLSLPPEAGIPDAISWRKAEGGQGSLRLVSRKWTEPPSDLFAPPKAYQRENLEEIEGFLP